ncbi:MAG: chemotaxis-specific protein-glutamate methyltransferase CheB, partial [Spartobacteria bacterium]|nr:chemotaxis-specific protein-glutamate methyltransferase CheB [Spartobacteria bacterium]
MRVGIVNDLGMAVEIIRQSVVAAPNLEIAWVARDGAEAVKRCAEDTPDIVLMDLIMPVMNGVEATRRIMQESPCAVLVVTASVGQNTSLVFEAMSHGAIDAVNTPVFAPDGTINGQAELLAKIRTIGQLLSQHPSAVALPQAKPAVQPDDYQAPYMVALGASTGGPSALADVLAGLPEQLPAAVVIIQHVDKQFAGDLAQWLNDRSSLPVQIAPEYTRPETGRVYLAGTNDHLIITPELYFRISAHPMDCSYRPSVDVFFQSLAQYWPAPGTAALLTGMGR